MRAVIQMSMAPTAPVLVLAAGEIMVSLVLAHCAGKISGEVGAERCFQLPGGITRCSLWGSGVKAETDPHIACSRA